MTNLNSVEDEMHFLFYCISDDDLRNFLFRGIVERNSHRSFPNSSNQVEVFFLQC